ncbi:hypothetical protein GCM10011445_21040 [Pseudocitrobacter faecalis]|uniref:DUF3617 family protein n=1 Tax=Pseudocitrobacter faecalis TaxID=1398493 RepID=UPI0016730F47|nr:DUF3617 family protein [Pseudocitrobacter faecalis]GHD93525.1 hypothetical protein GCM10011445_21040 [Pseudocitrobacter faecalis]
MKRVKLAAIFAFTLAGSHSAMALDIQPGEWVRESTGKTTHVCYTEKMVAHLKKISPGNETTKEGCTNKYTKNTDTLLVNETICYKQDTKMHSVVEEKKISDTELRMNIKMDLESGGKKASFNTETVEKFVGKECSEASKGKAQK